MNKISHPHKSFFKALIILNLLDVCITIFAVHGGYAEEMNPAMGYFLGSSALSFALFKIFVMQATVLIAYRRWQHNGRETKRWVWAFLISVYMLTVLWNIITVYLHASGVFT